MRSALTARPWLLASTAAIALLFVAPHATGDDDGWLVKKGFRYHLTDQGREAAE